MISFCLCEAEHRDGCWLDKSVTFRMQHGGIVIGTESYYGLYAMADLASWYWYNYSYLRGVSYRGYCDGCFYAQNAMAVYSGAMWDGYSVGMYNKNVRFPYSYRTDFGVSYNYIKSVIIQIKI